MPEIKQGKKYNFKNGIIRYVLFFAYVFLFYMFFLNLSISSEQEFQTPKDYFFCKGMLFFMLFLFLFRRIGIKKIHVWLTFVIGMIIMAVLFWIKGVNTANYGVVFFRVILFNGVVVVAFITLLVDALTNKNFKEKETTVRTLLFAAAFLLAFIFDIKRMIVVLLPVLALLMTDSSKDKKVMFSDSLAVGYYLAFLHVMTKSLILCPDRYENGRYLGTFSQVESAGMFCCVAFFCAMYIYLRLLWDTKKTKLFLVIASTLLFIYPIYSVIIISSRSSELAVLFSIACIFLFWKTKNGEKNSFIKRILTLLGIAVLGICSVFAVSFILNALKDKGRLSETNYFWTRVMTLTSKEYRYGYFGEDSFLNNVDRMFSGRIAIYVESIKQIGLKGKDFPGISLDYKLYDEPLFIRSTHNFFILWFINSGWIGGLLMVFWYCYYLVSAVRGFLKRNIISIAPMLLISAAFIIFSFTCINWKYPFAVVVLLLQYPIIGTDGIVFRKGVTNKNV